MVAANHSRAGPMRLRTIAVVALMFLGFSCATSPERRAQRERERIAERDAYLTSSSAGVVGCLPSAISISDYSESGPNMNWVAHCRDRAFVCTEGRFAGRLDTGPARCSPAAAAQPVAPAAPE